MGKKSALFLLSLLVYLNHVLSQSNLQNQQDLEFIPTQEVIFSAGRLFACSKTALLRSTNHGNSWNLIRDFYPWFLKGLAGWDTTIYALLKDYSTDLYKMAVINVNDTAPNVFDCIGIGPENGTGSGISALIAKDGILFAGNNYGNVFKSTDNGRHWANSSKGLITGFNGLYCNQAESVYDLYTDGTNLYAGTNCQGIYYSDDNGENWHPCNTGLPMETKTRVYDISGNSDKLYSITSKGVYYCSKTNMNWILDTRIPTSAKNVEINNNHGIVITPKSIFISNDDAAFWNEYDIQHFFPTFPYTNIVTYDTAGWFLCETTKGVVYYPEYDSIFTIKSFGLTKNNAACLYKLDSTILFSTLGGGLYFSPDLGNSWHINENELLGIVVNSIIQVNSTLVAATSQGVYYSNNNANNWVTSKNLLSKKNIRTICDFQNCLFAGTDSSVYYQKKNDSIWIRNNSGLNDSTIHFLYTKDNVLYACTNKGVSVYDSISKSWKVFGNFPQTRKVYSLLKSGNLFLAGSDSKILISDDNGISWTPSGLGNDAKVNVLVPFDTNIIAGTTLGVYVYVKKDQSWLNILRNTYDGFYNIRDILVSDSVVYGAANWGYFSINLKNWMFTNMNHLEQPKYFTLFPNPFKDYVYIDLFTDHASDVLINIYTLNGVRVYSENVIKPERKFLLNNLNLGSKGCYIIQVVCDDFTSAGLIFYK